MCGLTDMHHTVSCYGRTVLTRFLKRLMLVHGRWNYRRISKVVIFSFYKNIALTLVLFAFTFVSGYSGQLLFDDYIYSGYNFFLALPVVAFGIFDRDISAESLERYKMLYVSGRERLDMNIPVSSLLRGGRRHV
jgi:phospholipid-transporting ATPase